MRRLASSQLASAERVQIPGSRQYLNGLNQGNIGPPPGRPDFGGQGFHARMPVNFRIWISARRASVIITRWGQSTGCGIEMKTLCKLFLIEGMQDYIYLTSTRQKCYMMSISEGVLWDSIIQASST